MTLRTWLLTAVSLAMSAVAQAQATADKPPPIQPYTDRKQLDCPWPKHDHYIQPWRGYLETRGGHEFLQGIGVVYNHSENTPLVTRLLFESGFKTFRIELGFGLVKWDESGLANEERTRAVLADCKKFGIRPTILMNAHHGIPCPNQERSRRLVEPAKKGDRTVRLKDVSGLRAGYSGLSHLGGYKAAQIFFTEINAATGVCKLSMPLPVDLGTDKDVFSHTLKYRPLFPTGTPEYEESVAGFLRYVGLLMRLCREVGIDSYDLELWNELTFGSDWLDINYYYEPKITPSIDKLLPGGSCWELGRRVVEKVRREGPKDVRVIWGFSNITFYHTKIEDLPAGFDGQSYHPYGTGTRHLEFHEQAKDNPKLRQGPPPPVFEMRLPEGYALTFVQTESLTRLLQPAQRARHPKETRQFHHYMTEHGVLPYHTDVKEEAAAWRFKQKSILRAFSMLLNKGLTAMHWYAAGGKDWGDFGLLPANIDKLPADAKFDDVATPPMKALRNLTRCFADSVPIAKPVQLGVEITELTEPRKIFQGVPGAPSLWERECFAFLPFQATEKKFVVPVYVMTYDVTKEHPGSRYRLTIRGVPAGVDQATLYDPITDQPIAVTPTVRGSVMEIEVPVVDYPRVLTLQAK